jgi:Fe2+ or Zn2+ uptake regulation protein
MPAEDIFKLAKREMPTIARATIYNNLNYLSASGMIRCVRIANEPDRYDRVLEPHEHLICDRCGEISDIRIGDIEKELHGRTGIDITGYELNIHYICPKCGRKKK